MLGSPLQEHIIHCLCLRRRTKDRYKNWQWCIANGMNMGRWTINFGAHCLADDKDNKDFLRNIQREISNSELVGVTIHCNFNKDG